MDNRRRTRATWARQLLTLGVLVVLTGCVTTTTDHDASASRTASSSNRIAASPGRAPSSSSPGPTPIESTTSLPVTDRVALGQLAIDDHPHEGGYRRDEWPTWKDIDGDGCDAREQALRDASTVPPQIGPSCKILAGSWTSAYDGFTTDVPHDLDVDHVVPLADAHASGGWAWSTDQRAHFANDGEDLWVVSASANRSKGDRGPDEWRPPRTEVWCEYAQRWLSIKVRWGLTATTNERDALGQMLDTCDDPPG